MVQDVLIVVAGYLVGSIPFGVVVVRLLRGEDIRTQGSGNIGASNVWRSYGRWLGLPVALLDVLKGFVPAYIGLRFGGEWVGVLAGSAAMAGHARPIWLGFTKGGKMVATAGGVALALAPIPAAICLVVWIATFALFRYASLASIVTACALPILCFVLGEPWPTVGFAVVAGLAVILLHRQNIGRLLHGTESRFSRAADPAGTPWATGNRAPAIIRTGLRAYRLAPDRAVRENERMGAPEDQIAETGERRGRRDRGTRANAAAAAAGPAAVWPGHAGGTYRPLSVPDIERIHATALDVLEQIGIGEPIPEVLHYALPAGCTHSEDDRLLFPRGLVEEMMGVASRGYVRHAVDPANDIEISGERVYFCTSGEAVTVLDYPTQTFRPTRLVDLYDAARLVDRLPNIHCYGQPFIASELSEEVYVHDINVAYAAMVGQNKPFGFSCATVGHLDDLVAMFDLVAGGEGEFLKRPFSSIGGCPIVSPLRFGKDNAEVLVRSAELGLAADIAVAPQAGATAPAALAGALVQCYAETLACLVVVNLIRPGNPFDFGMWPFVSDLRTGAFSGGGGEEALLMAASAQIANHFGFVSSVATGMTDSKTMDAQAGYEKGITTTAAALAGGNLVSAYPGIVGSLMGQSFEGLLIDNDLLGNAQRLLRGIEVNDETLSYDVIKGTVFGIGHYLGSEQTVQLMRSEFQYPGLADRTSQGAWEEEGSRTIYDRAHERVKEILSTHYPEYIDPAVDAKIRERFPIRLDPADMRPGNGRW